MGGCNLTRSTGDIILNSGEWESRGFEVQGEISPVSEWSIMPRVEGRLMKKTYLSQIG